MNKVEVYSCFVYIVNIPFLLLFCIYDNMDYATYKPRKRKRQKRRPRRRRLICHAVAVYATTVNSQRLTPFDTDSAMIGIDN